MQRSLFDNVENQPQAEGTTDRQGNLTDGDGRLITEEIGSIDELTDEDFISPTRSVTLPQIPTVIDRAIGANGKPVVIKKNIFEKNRKDHPDVTPEQSREILSAALYDTDLYGQNKPQSKPYNWVVINTKDKEGNNRLVLLEVNETKDNVEVIHWHYIDGRGLDKIKRQAQREDGQLLILPSDTTEEAGALSGPTQGLSSESKSTQNSDNSQTNGEKNTKAPRGLAADRIEDFDGRYDGNSLQFQLTSGEDVRPATQEEHEETAYMADHFNAIGIPTSTDWEEGQRVLDMANGEGVRLQKRLNNLSKASNAIKRWLAEGARGKVFTIDLPESTLKMIRREVGRDFDSHNITINGIIHGLKNHGVNGKKLTANSIPIREQDAELIPYIMTAPDYITVARLM